MVDVERRQRQQNYAQRLVWLRKVCAGISQRELSRLSGMSQSNIGSLELHKQPAPAYESFAKLAKTYGVDVRWLAEGKGPTPDAALVAGRIRKRVRASASRAEG